MAEALLVEHLETLENGLKGAVNTGMQYLESNNVEMGEINEGMKTLIEKVENIGNQLTYDISRLERDIGISFAIGLGVYSIWKWVNNNNIKNDNKINKNKDETINDH